MADIEIDDLRIQIGNPCENWAEPKTIDFTACDGSLQQLNISRSNCSSEKIIGWFTSTWANTGSNSSGQIIARILNNCDTTEVRKSVDSIRFQESRSLGSTGQAAQLFCDRSQTLGLNPNFIVHGPVEVESGTCVSGETIYYRGKTTPLDDISYNSSHSDLKIGLETTGSTYPFVQYGTKALNALCDIESGCITGTGSLFFLYIPCGHYSSEWSSIGSINDKAFSNHTGLRGLWIDGNWGRYGDPFYNCQRLEIVYCPGNWVNYFADGTKFPNIKYINGTPYSEGSPLPTSCKS